MIDICPAGALTSRLLPLQRPYLGAVAAQVDLPHDSTGANLIVQVKNHRVMRVVPLENEAVNECWIADRDRFSYEALNGEDRLTRPMLKQGGQWQGSRLADGPRIRNNGPKCVRDKHGASAIGALVSPHSTLEELYLAGALVRLRAATTSTTACAMPSLPRPSGVRWLGTPTPRCPGCTGAGAGL